MELLHSSLATQQAVCLPKKTNIPPPPTHSKHKYHSAGNGTPRCRESRDKERSGLVPTLEARNQRAEFKEPRKLNFLKVIVNSKSRHFWSPCNWSISGPPLHLTEGTQEAQRRREGEQPAQRDGGNPAWQPLHRGRGEAHKETANVSFQSKSYG
ncbi:hypothetical protein AAY473_027911 [Plecturocebus cupreus]